VKPSLGQKIPGVVTSLTGISQELVDSEGQEFKLVNYSYSYSSSLFLFLFLFLNLFLFLSLFVHI
jgi:hypothetical protein